MFLNEFRGKVDYQNGEKVMKVGRFESVLKLGTAFVLTFVLTQDDDPLSLAQSKGNLSFRPPLIQRET